jgi:hypothetical protein
MPNTPSASLIQSSAAADSGDTIGDESIRERRVAEVFAGSIAADEFSSF